MDIVSHGALAYLETLGKHRDSDRLIVLDQGQIVADGPKAQVVEALQHGRIGRAG